MSDLTALITPAPYTVPRAAGARVRRPTVPVANTRVRPVTRWVAALVVFFLADAAQLLLLLPHRTAELFAWPIDARLSSFVLASAYVGGGYFFVRVALGGEWRRVAAGLPAVIVFVWLAALATALHLDRFTHDSVAFVAWAAIYLVAPFGLPLLVLSQRGRGASREPLPAGARKLMLLAGGAVTMAALLLFALPQPAIDVWPWALTPLTARIVAAVVALFGTVWVSVALHRDRVAARIPLEAHAIGLVSLLAAAARAAGDITWEQPLAPVLVAGVAAMLLLDVVVLALLRRSR